ncbi:MAG: hypothetical protein MUF87_12480 [Anaerolineae bacterium]|nr:hypothetical protein [Anaerolineae bacterium]
MAIPRPNILSWQLWNAIFRHQWLEHPIYTQVFKSGKHETDRLTWREVLMLIFAVICLLLILHVSLQTVPFWAISFLLISGSVSGLVISWRIVRALHREYAEHRYDLISVTLPGVTGFHWAQVTRVMMDDRTVFWMRWLTMGCYSLLLFPMLVLLLPLVLISLLQNAGGTWLLWAGMYVTVISVFLVDYVQSVLTAILLAITLTRDSKDPAGSLFQVITLFTVVQLIYYLVYGGIAWIYFGVMIVPLLMSGQLLIALVLGAIYPLALFALREMSLRWGCQIAENRYGLQLRLIS